MRDRIQGIEGLRVVAMVLVASWLTGLGPFHGGYVGLEVGFVIAGFFASRHVNERVELTARAFFIDVIAYRLRRVVPLTALVSILTGGFIIVVYGYSQLDAFMSEARSVILFFADFQLHSPATQAVSSLSTASPFAQFWTISLLQQLVLAWSAVYYYAHHRTSEQVVRRVFIVVLALVLILSGEFHYYSAMSSVLAFVVGAMYSWYHDRAVAQATWWHDLTALAGLIFILGSALVLQSGHHYSGAVGAGVALSTVVIISAWAPDGAGRLERLFEFRPLAYLGRYTFAFYLWLFPGLVILTNARSEILSTPLRALVVLGAAILAVLSHHYIEIPILKWLDPNDDRVSDELDFKITYRGTTILVAITVLFSFGFANMSHYKAVTAFKAAPPTALELALPPIDSSSFYPSLRELRNEIQDISIHGDKVNVEGFFPGESNLANDADSQVFADCTSRGNDGVARTCAVGDPKAKPSVLVIGDGEAVAIATSLQPLATKRHVAVFVTSRNGCRNNTAFDSFTNDRAVACATWHANLPELIRSIRPDVIVLSSAERNPRSGVANDTQWEKGHTRFIARIQQAAPKISVIDIGGWVYRPTDPVACLHTTKKISKTVGQCAVPRKKSLNDSRVVMRLKADKSRSVAFINMSKYFCTTTTCPAIVGSVATMANLSAPTQTYMRYITRAVEPELSRITNGARAHHARTSKSPPK